MKFLFKIFLFSCIWSCTSKHKCSQLLIESKIRLQEALTYNDSLKALEKIDKEIVHKVQCFDLLLLKANSYLMMDKLELAKKNYLFAFSMDTSNSFILYRIGIIYNYIEKYDSSIFFFEKALLKKTSDGFVADFNSLPSIDDYQVSYNKIIFEEAKSYYYWKKYDIALKGFNYCIENSSQLADSYLFRGSIKLLHKKNKEACDDFWQAKKYGNKDAMFYLINNCR